MGIEQEETGDFVVNEKDKVVNLTQEGVKKVNSSSRSITLQMQRTLKSSTM